MKIVLYWALSDFNQGHSNLKEHNGTITFNFSGQGLSANLID